MATEAKYIRREEAKTIWRVERERLAEHRRFTVRRAARYAQLAYGFIRGVPYRKIESKVHDMDYGLEKEVVRLVWKYGAWRRPYGRNGDEMKAMVERDVARWFSALD